MSFRRGNNIKSALGVGLNNREVYLAVPNSERLIERCNGHIDIAPSTGRGVGVVGLNDLVEGLASEDCELSLSLHLYTSFSMHYLNEVEYEEIEEKVDMLRKRKNP